MSITSPIAIPIAVPINLGISEAIGGVMVWSPILILDQGGLTRAPSALATLTNASTDTDATIIDHEGVVRTTLAGEVRRSGGRRVENKIASTDFANFPWAPGGLTLGAADADGWYPTTTTTANSRHYVGDAGFDIIGHRYSVDARYDGGYEWLLLSSSYSSIPKTRGAFFNIRTGAIGTIGNVGLTPTIEAISGGGYTCSIDEGDNPVSAFGVLICESDDVDSYVGDGASGMEIRRPMYESVAGQANKLPSEWVDIDTNYGFGVNGVNCFSTENGASEVSGILTRATGAAISPVPSILHEGAATNSIPASWDLTDAAWTVIGTSVAALDAVGMNGLANNATTLTDDNGAAHEYLTEAVTYTLATISTLSRAFILKDSDESRFVGLRNSVTGGSPTADVLHLNTKTGAYALQIGGTFTGEVNSYEDYWEVLLELAPRDSNRTDVEVYPAMGTVLGTAATAATGSCVVGNVEFHENKTIAEVRGTTPIFTTSASVTRDKDQIQISDVFTAAQAA